MSNSVKIRLVAWFRRQRSDPFAPGPRSTSRDLDVEVARVPIKGERVELFDGHEDLIEEVVLCALNLSGVLPAGKKPCDPFDVAYNGVVALVFLENEKGTDDEMATWAKDHDERGWKR